MTNNNKKYEMGGAVQSFSSPMLAQGMQGGLSGFGTSGLGMFADGGQMKLSDFQVGDIVSHKKGKGNAHGRIYKMSAIGFYLEDKYGNKSETHQIFPSDFKKVKKLADGGQISDIERILAKYRAIASNKPKEDKTSEFLNKSWEGKNLDDYIMYSDRYKRGGELSASQERAFFDKTKTKYTQLDADKLVGNFIEIYGQGQEEAIAYSKISKATIDPKYSAKTLIIYTETGTQERIPEDKIDSFFNGLPIVLSIPSKGSYYGLKLKGANEKDLYADGGEVNKYEIAFDKLEIGDVVVLKFDSGVNGGNDLKLTVKSKKLVGKGKPSESEQITFEIANNLTGKKFYAYKRKNGYVSFGYLGSGEMAVKDISIEKKYADGGQVNKYEATFDELKKGDVVTLKFGSSISRENDVKLIVKSKNLVGKGKTYESEKITFAQANNPTGVKFYAYKRKNGYVGFASGDMAISVNNISIENKYAKGGTSPSLNNGEINGRYLDSLSEIKQRRILMNVANHYEISLKEANDEVRDEEAELLYEYIADDNTLKMSIYYQFQDNLNKYAGGGEFEEEESMDVQFIEYNGNEIMYEPIMKKYYANDVEFDTLKEAQKFLDSGEMSDSIRGAYARGLYDKGGEVKKSSWVVIFAKGNDRKVLEVSASTREEAIIEAEKDKKRYGISPDLKLDDIFRKFAHGGEVSSAKNYLYEISTPFPVSNLVEELEELFGPGRVILNDWNSPEQLESVAMLNLTKNDINKIQSKIEDAIISKSEITDPEEMEMLNHYAKGGEIGFIPMGLEEKLILLAKWGGTNVRGVIGLLNAMIDSGITDEDLKYTLLKKETRLRREKAIEMKIDEIWTRIQPKYNQELKGNMYYSTLKELITLSGGTYENLLQKFKPFRKYQKFAKGGDVANPIFYAKTLGRDNQDWEAQLKEYAGDQYDNLTQEERREIIADMQRGYDRNTHFAKGGEVDRISIGDNVYAYFAQNYVGYQLVESPSMGDPYDGKVIDIINENNQKKYVVKFENGETKKLSQGIFDDYVIKEKFAQGGEVDESLKNAYRDLKNQIPNLKLDSNAIENSIECSVRDWGNWEHDYEDSYRDNFEDDDFMILSSNSIKKLNEIVKAIETKNPNVSINWDISEKNYIDFFISRKMAQGGKIGFEGLAKKVAKRYKGKAVSKEYQSEYGKTYDQKEAKEVGNKVAAKVYRQQVAKKKIVRKLQRKTN